MGVKGDSSKRRGKGGRTPFISDTIEFWAKRGIELNQEDARQAIDNISRFFTLLDRWDREDRGCVDGEKGFPQKPLDE